MNSWIESAVEWSVDKRSVFYDQSLKKIENETQLPIFHEIYTASWTRPQKW